MRYLTVLLTALAAVALMASAAAPAGAIDVSSISDLSDIADMMMPQAVMMTVTPGSMTGDTMTFTVPHAAKVYRIGNMDFGAVSTYNKPLQGQCNASAGTGQISTDGALPMTAVVDLTKNSTLPVAGAGAVIVLQDFKLKAMSKQKFDFEFGKMALVMPDGTMKAIKLDRPLRMSYSLDKMMMTMDAGPATSKLMKDAMKPGAVFPGGAKPIGLNTILGMK